MRILLVEDDPTLSNQVRQALEEADYAVDLAVDGRDAQYRGETEPFDAAILDLGLPLVDGITVLKSWRAHGISFPVLILTARDTWHEKVAGIDAGADDYLGKPFHMEELLARLRALLRRSRIATIDLVAAARDRVPDPDRWGSYYLHDPRVVGVNGGALPRFNPCVEPLVKATAEVSHA